jgi:hypothetical protein
MWWIYSTRFTEAEFRWIPLQWVLYGGPIGILQIYFRTTEEEHKQLSLNYLSCIGQFRKSVKLNDLDKYFEKIGFNGIWQKAKEGRVLSEHICGIVLNRPLKIGIVLRPKWYDIAK